MKTKFNLSSFLIFLFFSTSVPSYCQDKIKLIVAQDGSGDYLKIQDAIDACKAFPDVRITIVIRNGVYHEKVIVPAFNTHLSIIGENAFKTIITNGDYFDKMNRGRNSTFYTYTFKVEADDFYAENLTFENSSGPVGQAVALHVEGDRCTFSNCRIQGYQDSLYATGDKNRQYFSACYIEGTTDFIFGSATVLFENCEIVSKGDSYITAASTIYGKEFGFVFLNCSLKAEEGVRKVFLGRPWRDYANVVFIGCGMGTHILPEGWSDWSGTERNKTAFFAEADNRGPGSATSHRVSWSHQLTKKEATRYTLKNIMEQRFISEPLQKNGLP